MLYSSHVLSIFRFGAIVIPVVGGPSSCVEMLVTGVLILFHNPIIPP